MKRIFLTITLFAILAILPVSIFAQQNPFPDCNFVLEDADCKSYIGYSEAKVQSIIGNAESYGDYYRYGIHLWYDAGLKKIKFYGIKPKSEYTHTFIGKPHKSFDWGVSPDEVISKYRQPDSQRTWKLSEYVLTEFYYGKDIVVSFKDNKLSSVELIASKSEMESNKDTTPTRTPTLSPETIQKSCTIEVGKGCGKIQLGMTKTEIKSILGEGKLNSSFNILAYKNHSLIFEFDLTDRVASISFVINPRVYGDREYSAFSGNLPNNLPLQANPTQITQLLGKPYEQDTSSILYPGIEFGFVGDDLTWVQVTKLGQLSPTPGKMLAHLDCRYLLTVENCSNKLLEADRQMFIRQFGKNWSGQGFASVTFNRYSDRISWIKFSEGTLGFKPTADLDWNADIKTTIKILGKPLNRSKYKDGDEHVTYPNAQLQFEKGKLKSILFNRNETSEELAMESAERKRVENLPETKAKNAANQMQADYESLLATIESHNREGMRIIERNKPLIAMGGIWAKDVQNKLDKVTEKMDSAINRFLKKYEGQVPDWMIKGIQAKRSGQ